MRLQSPAFESGDKIPLKYTGEGQDVSPPLHWDDPPTEAAAFALLVEDPDAPQPEPFVHWIAYNIPGTQRELPERLPRESRLETQGGMWQGVNSFPEDNVGYRGPYPPVDHGRHRYRFHLYALRRPLQVDGRIDKRHFIQALQQADVVDEAELLGTYERSSSRPKEG